MKIPFPILFIFGCISIAGAVCLMMILTGCGTVTPVTVAATTESVTIPTVNGLMMAWSDWVNQGKANQSQVDAVKTAYTTYYNAQINASNAFSAYFALGNSATNTAQSALQSALQIATSSQTNLIGLVQSFQK